MDNLKRERGQAGNILVYIIGAIVLLGLLFAILRGNYHEGSDIDAEKAAIYISKVREQAADIERAVAFIQQNGFRESEIRFAHPDADAAAYGSISDEPGRQVFSGEGGAAEYKLPPPGINDGTAWQFYATTHIPQIGTDTEAGRRSELIAVLPDVGKAFCFQMNAALRQRINLDVATDPASKGCVYDPGDEFAGAFAEGSDANFIDHTKVTHLPPRELCVRCSDGSFHYYRILLER